MGFDLDDFRTRYDKWVKESLADYRAGNMKDIIKRYPFVVSLDVPWTPFEGEPSEKTFALVTSGGLYLKASQAPFDTESINGDPSFREIPRTVSQEELGIAHSHYDHRLVEEDYNTIFPMARFLELEEEGVIGRVADRHYSFTYINDVAALVSESVPELIRRLKADGVGALFLVPV